MPTRLKVIRPQLAFSPYVHSLSVGATVTVSDEDAVSLINDGACVRYVEGLDDNLVNWEDVVGSASIDPVNRILYSAYDEFQEATPESINWGLRTLNDSFGTPVVNWDSYTIDKVGEGVVLDWDQRYLYSGTGSVSVSWGSWTLFNSDQIATVAWNSQTLIETGYEQVALNWNNFQLYDQDTAIVSANWSMRQLYDASAELSVDWQNHQLRASGYDISVDWFSRFLYGAWTTQDTGKTSANVMSMANYAPTVTSGTYNPTAPANAGMSIYHVASTNALIAAMTLALHGTSSAIDSVPIGAVMSFTSRYGVTALTVTYGGYTVLGTAVTTIAAGATVQWRKVGATTIARL